jgi:tRNA1(Val) A37 N6-methylase TrmN6
MSSGDPSADHTVDAFHRGGFWLVQPSGRGHRAGLDAMLLAAAVPEGFGGRLADLGAGAGAAGLAVASRLPRASVTLVEDNAEMAAFARLSLDLPANAALAGRVELVQADVTLAGKARRAAGLKDGAFDFVIMNPPFNDPRGRASPDPLRRAAHVMAEAQLGQWIRTASAIARPDGALALIARPAALAPLLAALEGRFGAIRIRPVHPRPGAEAIRILLGARRGSRKDLSLSPPLVLHPTEGRGYTAEAEALINGEAALFAG